MSGELTIIVSGPDQPNQQFTFKERELAIGRAAGNDIVLRDINVSRRHARLVVHEGKYVIIDVESTNGTYVNGRRVRSPMVVGYDDRVQIGGYTLAIEESGVDQTEEHPLAPFIPRDATEAALLRAIGEGDD